MKITTFLGSPRRKGHTAGLLDRVRQKLMADRHNVEMIHLAQLQISPCQECFECQKVKEHPGCCRDDDMQDLYRRIMDSDAIVLALYFRYLKRVAAHLTNIASSIVNPFPRIGFRAKDVDS